VAVLVAPGIYTVDGCFSPAECQGWIAGAGEYEVATITTANGAVRDAGLRNNSRAIRDDAGLADNLWRRLRQHVPPFLDGRQAIGINERFRFYRYDQAQYFTGHVDGVFRCGNGEESRLTLMVYLNDDFAGGETAFADTVIVPSTGLVLLFRHELFHEGRPVKAGVKHVLRSDVMYGPIGRLQT